jgi:L-iditol 2-dehydrogenase
MLAAVYHGKNDMRLETVPVPAIGPGELLVRVHACGICGTDLKKISSGSHSAPRIFGHETAGIVVRVGDSGGRAASRSPGPRASGFRPGDRVLMFHHMPCRRCFYCQKGVFAQCATYKKVGCTAGLEPSGGGFSEYVRVMDWIVRSGGVVRLPEDCSFARATFVEPVNTCLKGIQVLAPQRDETVLVMGQGPIGIILALLAKRAGARVITTDLLAERLTISKGFGLAEGIDAARADTVAEARARTAGRGADAVVLAAPGGSLIRIAMDAARPGGRIMLFAQTVRGEALIDPAAVCVDEKTLLGSYSASVELQEETAALVFGKEIDFERLISHRSPLSQAVEALHLAAHPQCDTMKVVLQPDGRLPIR